MVTREKQNWPPKIGFLARNKIGTGENLASHQKETSEESGTWEYAFSPETKPVPPQLVTLRERNFYLENWLLARNKLVR